MEDDSKPRDLEDRTFLFAESVRAFVKELPRTVSNTEDVRQLVRASGSVAANWIEADEALFFVDYLKERVMVCLFRDLAIEFSLGFGNWDLELPEE